MTCKRILLINESGTQVWVEQMNDGSLWKNGKEIFASEDDARWKGWKVDAVKVIFESPGEKEQIGIGERVA